MNEYKFDENKLDLWIDFSRPIFESDSENSMDFIPGQVYDIYISYYLGRPDSTNINKFRVFGGEVEEVNGEQRPVFKKVYINFLRGVLEEPERIEVE